MRNMVSTFKATPGSVTRAERAALAPGGPCGGLSRPQGQALGPAADHQSCPLFSRKEPGLASASTLSGLPSVVFENHNDITISRKISCHAASPSWQPQMPPSYR